MRQLLLLAAVTVAVAAIVASGSVAATGPSKIIIKVCDHDDMMTCSQNCTTYYAVSKSCWDEDVAIPGAGESFDFECKFYPKCFYGQSFQSDDCSGTPFRGASPCNFCQDSTSSTCSGNEVVVKGCDDKSCSVNCTTIVDATVGVCAQTRVGPGMNASLLIAGYKPCSQVGITNYWNSKTCSNSSSGSNHQWSPSGACTWSESRGGVSYDLSFACEASIVTDGPGAPLHVSKMLREHRAALRNFVKKNNVKRPF